MSWILVIAVKIIVLIVIVKRLMILFDVGVFFYFEICNFRKVLLKLNFKFSSFNYFYATIHIKLKNNYFLIQITKWHKYSLRSKTRIT